MAQRCAGWTGRERQRWLVELFERPFGAVLVVQQRRLTMTSKFLVEIRASDRSWFAAVEAPMSADAADRLIAKLRDQGFEARARLTD